MAVRRAPKSTPKFWELPGYKFCTAEMEAWVGGKPSLFDDWCAPKQGKPRDAAAAARLKAGRAKGKAKNKAIRDAIDAAKAKAKEGPA